MSHVYVVFPPDAGADDFEVWLCDLIHPGKRVATCPTRTDANTIARLLGLSTGRTARTIDAPVASRTRLVR